MEDQAAFMLKIHVRPTLLKTAITIILCVAETQQILKEVTRTLDVDFRKRENGGRRTNQLTCHFTPIRDQDNLTCCAIAATKNPIEHIRRQCNATESCWRIVTGGGRDICVPD